MGGNEEIDKYLKALSHPIRRSIIKLLAEKGPMSYSELMKAVGVGDSGTFAFHLKMLQGFVKKNEDGRYELTDKGMVAYRALKMLSGEEALETREVTGEGEGIVIIRDRIHFKLTKSIAEKLAKEGKELMIKDCLFLDIEDMPEDLLDKVLAGIEDVISINAPKNLQHIIELKSKDVLVTESGAAKLGGAIASLVGGIVPGVMRAVSLIVPGALKAVSVKEERMKIHKTFEMNKEFTMIVRPDASKISFKPGNGSRVVITGEVPVKTPPEIIVREDEIKIDVDAGDLIIEYPRNLMKSIKVDSSASSIQGTLVQVKGLKISCDAGNVDLNLEDLGRSDIIIDADASNIKLKATYKSFEGESIIDLSGRASYINVSVTLPQDTKVNAEIYGTGYINVDGINTRKYADQGYEASKSRLKIVVDNGMGYTRVYIRRSAHGR